MPNRGTIDASLFYNAVPMSEVAFYQYVRFLRIANNIKGTYRKDNLISDL